MSVLRARQGCSQAPIEVLRRWYLCRQIASEWTRHQAWTILQSALSAAVREELVSRNVAALVKVSTPRARRTLFWTVDQSRQFLENAHDENDPYYVAYVLMLVLGLRRGEVLGLGWDDVDLDAGKATIAWQLQRIRGQLLRRPTKTAASDSALPLPRICITALESRRDTERQLRAKAHAWHESHLVLTTPLGGHVCRTAVDPRNFHRAFVARCRKAGLPVTTAHATRKARASLLVALDVHPRVAMQILRHSQIAVTMDVYSQVTSDSTSRALKRLGEELEGR
jgi:integrase